MSLVQLQMPFGSYKNTQPIVLVFLHSPREVMYNHYNSTSFGLFLILRVQEGRDRAHERNEGGTHDDIINKRQNKRRNPRYTSMEDIRILFLILNTQYTSNSVECVP